MNLVADQTDSFPGLLQSIIRSRTRCHGCSLTSQSLLGGYYQLRPLEILSHTDYNTAFAEIVD